MDIHHGRWIRARSTLLRGARVDRGVGRRNPVHIGGVLQRRHCVCIPTPHKTHKNGSLLPHLVEAKPRASETWQLATSASSYWYFCYKGTAEGHTNIGRLRHRKLTRQGVWTPGARGTRVTRWSGVTPYRCSVRSSSSENEGICAPSRAYALEHSEDRASMGCTVRAAMRCRIPNRRVQPRPTVSLKRRLGLGSQEAFINTCES